MNRKEGKWFMSMVQDFLEFLDPELTVRDVLKQVRKLNSELSEGESDGESE